MGNTCYACVQTLVFFKCLQLQVFIHRSIIMSSFQLISFVSKFFFNFKKLIKLGPSDSILLITKQWGHNEPYKKLVQIQKIRVVVQKTIDSGDNKEYTRSKAFLKEKTPSCPPKRLQWCPFKSFCLLLFWISNYLHMYLCRSMRTSYQRCPMVLLI